MKELRTENLNDKPRVTQLDLCPARIELESFATGTRRVKNGSIELWQRISSFIHPTHFY